MDYQITIPNSKDLLDLLFYETKMLEMSFPFCYSPKDDIDKNVRLEAFLLHARNLIDFLENNKTKKDDVVCSSFNDINGNPIVSIQLSLSSDIKDKINKHLSHITTKRLLEKPAWNIELIKISVNQGLAHFFNVLSPNYFPTQSGMDKNAFEELITNNLIRS